MTDDVINGSLLFLRIAFVKVLPAGGTVKAKTERTAVNATFQITKPIPKIIVRPKECVVLLYIQTRILTGGNAMFALC